MWLHHRTPPHFSREVTEFLNENYEEGMQKIELAHLITHLEPIRFLSVELHEGRSKASPLTTGHK
jgi:hypothetical protein